MALAPVGRKLLSELVEEKLLEHIRDSGLVAGSPLPGEVELARQLGVSRSVVREAIGRLRQLGMIDSRKNRGAMLTVPDPFAGLERVLDSPLLDTAAEWELMELRVTQELGFAELFWQRKTAEDIAFLAAVGKQLDNHPDCPTVTSETKDLEKAFHGRIVEASGNRFGGRMLALLDYFYELERVHRRTPPLKRRDLPGHVRLVECMQREDRSRFREALFNHLRVYLDLVELERQRSPGG
jgi:DNA-binding FadR family transcriptional regulator